MRRKRIGTILWGLLLIFIIADIITTHTALSIGLHELNPRSRELIKFSFTLWAGLKLILYFIPLFVRVNVEDKIIREALDLSTIPVILFYISIVFNNIALIIN